jgi:hypothetical protein
MYSEKIYINTTLSTTNPARPNLGSNLAQLSANIPLIPIEHVHTFRNLILQENQLCLCTSVFLHLCFLFYVSFILVFRTGTSLNIGQERRNVLPSSVKTS